MIPAPTLARRIVSRVCVLLAVAAVPLALWAALPLGSSASTEGRISSLRNRIDNTEGRLESKNGRAQVLSTTIAGYTQRINSLQSGITRLQTRENAIQADLDAKRAELARIQVRLRVQQARLARLRARLSYSRKVLARRLVEIYQSDSDKPDIVTVVLNSKGFAQLLESGEYLSRIGRQDRAIITAVRDAKAAATTAVKRLDSLERRQQKVAAAIMARRNQVAGVRQALEGRRSSYAAVRDRKASALASVRSDQQDLRGKLDSLRGEVADLESRIQSAQGGGGGGGGQSLPAGPVKQGSGSMIWPVNGPITSPFCERRAWESCHPGVDIGVPSGTPIRAAASGSVILAGQTSGYGNYTCISHGGGLSTCYAHQSSIQVSVGQHVSQGQVIGLSGCTGLCFGPHLHFEVRINGAVTNPLNYL